MWSRAKQPSTWLLLLTVLVSIVVIQSSLLGYALFHPHILTWDEWDFYFKRLVPYIETPVSNMPFLLRLWVMRNGHRLFFPGLIQRANWLWFHADLANLVFLNIVVMAVSAGFLCQSSVSALSRRFTRWALCLFVIAVLLWLGDWKAIYWGFGLTYTLAVLGVTAACYCIYRCCLANGPSHGFWLAGAVAAGVLASLSWGSGILVWPVLILLALALRLPRSSLLTITGFSVAVIAVYMGYMPANAFQPIAWPATPAAGVDMGNRILGLLGNMPTMLITPFTDAHNTTVLGIFARIAGFLGLLALMVLILSWWRWKEARRWLLPCIGVALFVLGTAVSIGIERRVIPGLFGQVRRYRVFSTLFWAALACGFIPLLSGFGFSLKRRLVMALPIVLFLAIFVNSQYHRFLFFGLYEHRTEVVALGMINKVANRKLIHRRITPHDDEVMAYLPYVRHHHLTLFRKPWTHWTGTRLPGTNQAVPRIRGGVAKVQVSSHGRQVSGWTSTVNQGGLVVGVTKNGSIKLIATFTGLPRYAMRRAPSFQSEWLSRLHAIHSWLPTLLGYGRSWVGFCQPGCKPHKLRYFVVTPDKRIISRLVGGE